MIETFIKKKFPRDNPQSIAYQKELIRVCTQFVESGLADPKFAKELTSGQESKFWSCLSEALLADRLRDKFFLKRPSIGEGPDFLLIDKDRKIWIEVICPEPKGLPSKWLNCEKGIIDFPYNDILLRWTAAIKEKAEKLIGSGDGSTKGYLQTGIVASNDSYVIAVNGCQLRDGPFSAFLGISQFPFAAEAVFPFGPLQLKISKETRKVVERGYQHRPYIINRNDAKVPAYTFLDPRFKSISAIWAVDVNGQSVIGNEEPTAVIHNPIAINPIPVGFLPAGSEYVATPSTNNEFVVEKINSQRNHNDG